MSTSSDPMHPDLVALDLLRAGAGTPEHRAHVAACDACRAAISDLERIAGAVRDRNERSPEIPEEIDRAILASAAVELARLKNRPPARFRRWVPAAAACILAGVATFLALPRRPDHADLPGQPGATVDIVDAYQLARALRSREPVGRAWDWNQDGLVDGKDVDAITIESVSLSRRTK